MDRRSRRTKESIRRAFIDLIQIKSINKITVTELAKEADIDRKTFYLHYNTITDIINEIGDEVGKKLTYIINEN